MNMDTTAQNPLKYSVHTRLRQFHLKRLLPAGGSGLFLDVGCGTGYLTQTLANGYTQIGLESDILAARINLENGLPGIIQGDARKLPIKDGCVDVAICSELLEHLPDDDDIDALREIARVLKPGGCLHITVPSLEGWRSTSALRNLGHNDPTGGEYHYRMGYSWEKMEELIGAVPELRLEKRRYSMFMVSELFMDILKLIYHRNNVMKDQADIMNTKMTPLFKLYRVVFPFLHIAFIIEDLVFCPFFKGHILVISMTKKQMTTRAP